MLQAGNGSLVPQPTKGARGVPSPLISSWVYIKSLRMVAEIAAALGHVDDAAKYASDAARSEAAFLKAYLRSRASGGGKLSFADGSLRIQAANALGLDLFPKDATGSGRAAGSSAGEFVYQILFDYRALDLVTIRIYLYSWAAPAARGGGVVPLHVHPAWAVARK
jgi:hypothetical protein